MTVCPAFAKGAAVDAEVVSLESLVAAHARSRPDAPALVQGERTWSYAHLDAMVGALLALAIRKPKVG